METHHGTFPLRDFFDTGRVAASGGGESSARLAIHERLRQLVAGESPEAPLSDDELVALLGAHGIRVARRTVAKYRGELSIPSSWRRRKHA